MFKRRGPADQLPERTAYERGANLAAGARVLLGGGEGKESEMPATLPPTPLDVALPDGWRVYSADPVFVAALAKEPLITTLAEEGSTDEVIELLDDLIVIYQARAHRIRDFGDAGPTPWPRMAQYIIDDGLQIVDAVTRLTASIDPRGVHAG
jgi:hypothetical protein